ncbi:MAG: NepR family anti-sigma factor [Sphingobium sp.]|nr:NepR family anti-sigma factor [Sphingobium sp.]
MAPLDASAAAGEVSSSSNPAQNSGKKPRKGTQRVARGGSPDQNVGNVLRSVYQNAVQEEIPPEMLDLLSKLD